MTVLVREAGGDWREPNAAGYGNEAALQKLIYEHPTLVPGVSGDVAACREFQSGIGPADVMILDGEGSLTVVECKLASNAEIRRKIVGQVLDYGSRMWRMSTDEFERIWMAADPDRLSPFARLDDSDGRIREALRVNLEEPRFNLVLAVDQINDDLRRIVEYLNTITRPSTGVMLVEFARFQDGTLEMLMPRTYGAELVEAKNEQDSRDSRPRWTVDQYLDWCDAHDPANGTTMRTLVAALQSQGFYVGGGRAQTPSLNCAIEVPGLGRRWPVCLYTDPGRGGLVEIRFSDFKTRPEIVADLARRVCDVPGFPQTFSEVESAGYRKRPNIPIRDFTPATAQELASAVAAVAHDN